MKNPYSERAMTEVQRALEGSSRKEKTSVSLSGGLLDAIDVVAGKAGRSAFIEKAVRRYFRGIIRSARNRRDLEKINAHADAINKDSDWLLEIQAWPE